MQPLHPLPQWPDSYAYMIDQNARREEARRLARHLAATRDNTQARHREQPETTAFPEIEPKDGGQILAESEPIPNLDRDNAALIPETSPNDNPTTYRIAARMAQLKVFLKEEGDQFSAHIRSPEDVEEFEEAMELLHLDENRVDLSAGYPLTEDGFVSHCRVLFDAMKNLVDILDVVAGPGASGRPSYPYTRTGDSLAVKFVKSKKPIEINIVAGKLMRVIRKAQCGRLPTLGRDFHEYGSFTLRFQAVVDALKVSKLLVRSAFESDEWLERIVINPDAELTRKKLNKTNNEAKAEKHRFANQMKKNDPTLNFKDYQSIKSTQASTSSVIPSLAGQAQQHPSQGTDIQSPQAQRAPDSSPAPRPSKRVKISQEQPERPELCGPSSAYENNINQDQQLSGGQAIGPDHQSLQIPQDGSLDAGSTESRLDKLEAALRWSMEERYKQREPGFASPGTPHAFVTPGTGHGTTGGNGQVASARGVALDPNPFNVPGPIQQYGFGLHSQAGPGYHGQATSGLARFRVIGGTRARIAKDESQQNQTDNVHHDG